MSDEYMDDFTNEDESNIRDDKAHLIYEDYKQLKDDFLLIQSFVKKNITLFGDNLPSSITKILEHNPPSWEESDIDQLSHPLLCGNQMEFHSILQRNIQQFNRTRKHFALMLIGVNLTHEQSDLIELKKNEIIKKMGMSIREHIRESDLVFHLERFEFSLILPKIRRIGARIVAEKMRFLLKEEMADEFPQGTYIDVSIGIGLFDNHWAMVSEKFLPEVYKTLNKARESDGEQILIAPIYIPSLKNNVSEK